MALTVASNAAGPGAAGVRPALLMSPRVMKMGIYNITFDSSYPTGGEDFSGVSNDFVEVVGVIQIGGNGLQEVDYDTSTDTLLLYVEDGTSGINAQAANGSNQSAVSVQLLVLGY